ncbi:MAG: hypothetical protein LBO66_00870 [Deltaproteobacteria bacterium]|nr:hypothetical protein [Deltaproteobacteria bacterium]
MTSPIHVNVTALGYLKNSLAKTGAKLDEIIAEIKNAYISLRNEISFRVQEYANMVALANQNYEEARAALRRAQEAGAVEIDPILYVNVMEAGARLESAAGVLNQIKILQRDSLDRANFLFNALSKESDGYNELLSKGFIFLDKLASALKLSNAQLT